ncbi:MAG TPA: glycosyltransferase family 39 protein [Methylomirabilota bacterium]|nr:glycosyltransferase family 39 protein [Methylomirabilota bacterium]
MALAIGVYLIQKLLLYTLDMNWEEGRDAQAYLRVMQGKMPYRDFRWNYGPLSPYVFAGAFSLFGPSLAVLRLTAIAAGALGVGAAYFVSRRMMPAGWAFIAAVFSMLLFHTPTHTYNHIFATVGALLSMLLVLKCVEENRSISAAWAGSVIGVSILTKPLPMGGANFVAASVALAFRSRRVPRDLSALAWGTGAVVLPVAAALLAVVPVRNLEPALFGSASQVFGPWRYPNPLPFVREAFLEAWRHSPWAFYDAVLALFNAVVSWLPVVTPLLACACLVRATARETERSGVIALSVLAPLLFVQPLLQGGSGATGYLGDGYTHAPAWILAAYLGSRLVASLRAHGTVARVAASGLVGGLVLAAWVIPYFPQYLNVMRELPDDHPLAMRALPLSVPRAAGIRIGAKLLVEDVVGFIQAHVDPSEPIVFMHYNPMFLFLSERESLFPEDDYIFIRAGASAVVPWPGPSPAAAELIIERLRDRRPRFIFVQSMDYSPSRAGQSEVWRYIERAYVPIKTFGASDFTEEMDLRRPSVRVYALKEPPGQ